MVLNGVDESLLGGREKAGFYSHYPETGPGKLAVFRGGHIKKGGAGRMGRGRQLPPRVPEVLHP